MKIIKIISCVALAAALGVVGIVRAGETPKANPFLTTLSSTPLAELPAQAAALVSQADAKQQLQTTIDVVKAAVGLNPAAAPAIVGSIAQGTPQMAATAAATAARLVPNQAGIIARAAAAAAPKQAGKIVEAVCRVLPDAYIEVAEGVADVVPGAAKEILEGVIAAIPQLKDPVNKVLVSYRDGTPSVVDVLEKVKDSAPIGSLTPATAGMVSSAGVNPVVLPPYTPPPVSPKSYSAATDSGQVPPGGRNPPPP